jgi:hypothetical protein
MSIGTELLFGLVERRSVSRGVIGSAGPAVDPGLVERRLGA